MEFRRKINYTAAIDSGSTLTYLPRRLHKEIINEFDNYCKGRKGEKKCGKFEKDEERGYCASFHKRNDFLNSLKYWPKITLELDNNLEYKLQPINYHYYYYVSNETKKHKVCFGFAKHREERIILGANSMRGYDLIFDKEKNLFGYVKADCSRGNIISKDNSLFPVDKSDGNMNDVIIQNTENNNNKQVEFITGKNKELELIKDYGLSIFSRIIILIIVVVILYFIGDFIYRKKEYQKYLKISSEEGNKLNNLPNNTEESNNNKVN